MKGSRRAGGYFSGPDGSNLQVSLRLRRALDAFLDVFNLTNEPNFANQIPFTQHELDARAAAR